MIASCSVVSFFLVGPQIKKKLYAVDELMSGTMHGHTACSLPPIALFWKTETYVSLLKLVNSY
jgi:hypothetical protein